jgi:hypothetical protein
VVLPTTITACSAVHMCFYSALVIIVTYGLYAAVAQVPIQVPTQVGVNAGADVGAGKVGGHAHSPRGDAVGYIFGYRSGGMLLACKTEHSITTNAQRTALQGSKLIPLNRHRG